MESFNSSIAKVLLILLLTTQGIFSQTSSETETEEINWFEQVKSATDLYGRLHLGAGFAEGGEIGISNNTPRAGLKLKHALSPNKEDNFNVIGRIELGFNLVSRDETVEFAVDPGAGVAQVGDAVFARLGFVGITYKDVEFTFGKQNSVYYELGASWVDRTSAFGGAAIGVWNIGDGGVSGTGRANQVFKVKYKKNGFQLGAQAQARNISENSQSIDTYGFAGSYSINGFSIGIGYNKVEDGVENPLPNQAKSGDEALVASASYEGDRFIVAAAYSNLKQHQQAGDVFYDAQGTEVYAGYKFSQNKRWKAALGYNYLTPDDDENVGDFNTSFMIAEISYAFKPGSSIYTAARLDNSKNSTGNERRESLYGIGIKFSF